MGNPVRWTRQFTSPSSFADDLGSLGVWVGRRIGPAKRTQGQKEDYVLRRVLVALHRQGKLNFPFSVRASKSESPDFEFTDASGSWGLEVTEAGSEQHQQRMTNSEKSRATVGDHMPVDNVVDDVRRAIKKKNRKFESGAYHRTPNCDLAVFDGTGSYTIGHKDIASVNEPSLKGGFRQVFFVLNRAVYIDVLCNFVDQPDFVDISRDYNIDFAEWVRNQASLLQTGDMSPFDMERLIEELSELAKSERRALHSHLRNLLHHLLKWQLQPERRGSSWQTSINNARDEIADLLADSPSLRNELEDFGRTYSRARRNAATETGLPLETFPEVCPFNLDNEVLEEDWLPGDSDLD